MNHKIKPPCYVECEYGSELYHKAVRVFGDFGDVESNFPPIA